MKSEEKAELWDFAKEMAYNILKFNEGLYESKNKAFKIKVTNEIIHNGEMIDSPTRYDHYLNTIEINKHVFVKLDDALRIAAILWASFRHGMKPGQSLDEDLVADKRAIDLILENDYDFEKVKFAMQYTKMIDENPGADEGYRTARTNEFLKYYYKKIGHPYSHHKQ